MLDSFFSWSFGFTCVFNLKQERIGQAQIFENADFFEGFYFTAVKILRLDNDVLVIHLLISCQETHVIFCSWLI